MTDADVVERLERFGRDIRAEAASEDARHALADVRARAGDSAAAGPGHRWRRHAFVVLAGAAAATVFIVGAAAWLRTTGDTVQTTTPTSLAPVPTVDTTPPSSSVSPTTTSAPASSTVPSTQPAVTELTVRVNDVLTDAGPRPSRELYRAPAGALGFEQCDECDPVGPWGPAVTPDGRVVIADELNRRWVVVSPDGEDSTVPYPAVFRAVSPPVVGPDGRVYVVNGDPGLADGEALLTVFDVGDLDTAMMEVAVPYLSSSLLWFSGTRLYVNGEVVLDSISPPANELPVVEWHTLGGPASILVTWNGVRRTWLFNPLVSVGAAAPAGGALPDGSVLVIDVDSRETMRLFPDGTAVRFKVPDGVGYNGSRQETVSAIVQLERDDRGDVLVARHYLPPWSPTRELEPLSVSFQATGTAIDICRAAGLAVSNNGEYDIVVLGDTTSTVDGTEWRWLFCTGESASGWTVTALVSDDSEKWKLTDLELGPFNHAGDSAVPTVDGARATVHYESMVGERVIEATTTDLGSTWAVSDARSAVLNGDPAPGL